MVYKRKVFIFILYLLISLISASLLFLETASADEDEALAPNYPLTLVRYIYGKDKGGTNDTPDKGGTPVYCAQNSAGHLYVLYTGSRSEIQVFDQQGRFLFSFGERGKKEGLFSSYVCGLSINSNNQVFVADVFKRKILVFNQSGKYLKAFSSIEGIMPEDPKKETYPAHIAIAPDDRVYVSDGLNGHVYIYSKEGSFLKYLGGPKPGLFPAAGHISFDRQGQVYILEGLGNCCIQACTPDGTPVRCIGEAGTRAGEFSRISGLAIDSYDRIFATDIVQCVIQIFGKKGDLIGVVKEITDNGESRKLTAPTNIFIGKEDFIYVIEQPLHRLVVLKDTRVKRGSGAFSNPKDTRKIPAESNSDPGLKRRR